jgi:hypothetical protein
MEQDSFVLENRHSRYAVCRLKRSLFPAVSGGWLRNAQLLFENGAELDIDPDNNSKCHPTCHLIGAVKYRQPEMVKWLLDIKDAG